MSYEKQTWQTGDTITAAKLNNMEDGIADAGYDLVIKYYYDEGDTSTTLEKGSFADAIAKINAGEPISARVYECGYYGDWYYRECLVFNINAQAENGSGEGDPANTITILALNNAQYFKSTVRNYSDSGSTYVYGIANSIHERYYVFTLTESGLTTEMIEL